MKAQCFGRCRRSAAGHIGFAMLILSLNPVVAQTFTFGLDQGNAPGLAPNVSGTTTSNGVTMTLTAMGSNPVFSQNSTGVGVDSDLDSGGATIERRIDGTLPTPESVQFSFDTTLRIDSILLGSFSGNDGSETMVLSYVSGVNPFASLATVMNPDFTLTGTSVSYKTSGGINGLNTPDFAAGIAEPLIVEAGTVLSITANPAVGGGFLFDKVGVSLTSNAPPVGSLILSVTASFPGGALARNTPPGGAATNAVVSSGHLKGQTLSFPSAVTISNVVLQVDDATASADLAGTLQLQVFQTLNDLPVGSVTYSDSGTLPEGLQAGDLLQITLPTPLDLPRGRYAVTVASSDASVNFKASMGDAYPSGVLLRRDVSTGQQWVAADPVGQDLVFAVSGSEHPEPTVPTNRPNILVILADDLGWTDIQTRTNFGPNYLNGTNHGSDYYQTPNIARLAHEGLSFTHCYAQPNCSPMRAATLSGQYASRSGNGVYNVDGLNRGTGTPTLVGPAQNQDVPSSTVTSAESLRAGGYVTAHFGKYHVGGHEGGTSTLPLNQGFDWNFGGGTAGNPGSYFASGGEFHSNVGPELDGWAANYDVPYVNSVLWPLATNRAPNPNNPGTLDGTAKHLGDAMADAAIAFLKDHVTGPLSHRPFYLQFHTYEVHTPIQPRPDLQAKYSGLPAGTKHGGVNYAALVESQDQQVGRLLDFLDDPNHDGDKSDSLVTNTVVFFTSDNGGHEGATDNAPLRAHKGTHYEGGLRVPLIVRHTGTVPAGQMTDTLVHAVDFYPTFLDLSGAPAPTNQVLDGTSFAAHLMAPGAHPRHRPPMFYHFPGYLDERARPCSVIIKEVNGARYKLIYNYDYAYDPVPSDDGIKILTQPWELYNLTEDLSEARNLIDGTYSGSLLEGAIADELAGDLVAWLTQATPGWNAKQPTVRATGATVPYPPGDVPDIPPPGGQPFRVTHTDVNQAARQVTLTWNSETGFRYLIWGSSNLWDWSLLLTNINPSGAVTAQTLTDLNIGDHPRYYRVEVRRP